VLLRVFGEEATAMTTSIVEEGRRRTRVVHVSSAHPATDPRIFEKECTSLFEAGYDVRLVATGTPPPDARLPVRALIRSSSRLRRMTTGAARAVVTALLQRPHVVHFHDPELIPWVPLVRLLGIRVVFDSHEDLVASLTSKTYLDTAIKRRVAYAASRMVVSLVDKCASGIICATPTIAQRYGNPHARVVQNLPVVGPAPAANNHGRIGLRPAHAVYVGAISKARGLDQMLAAVDRLANSHGLRLLLAGSMDPAVLDQARAHPGWRHVDYVGVLDRAGVNDILAQADVGLVLLQPEPNYVRSQPTKMFEYMAAGLPIVASNFPLWRAFVDDVRAGLVVDPSDVDEIVAAIGRLLEDPVLASDLGRNGRTLAESQWNWSREAPQLVDFYDALVGLRPATTVQASNAQRLERREP
jgi:glycosyltransferase involved in cell wall biosynthesis